MPDRPGRQKAITVSDRLLDLASLPVFYIVTLAIEFLTMVFRYSHKPDEFRYMFEAAAVAVGIALLFFAWAYYNKTSVSIEQHEHEICDNR